MKGPKMADRTDIHMQLLVRNIRLTTSQCSDYFDEGKSRKLERVRGSVRVGTRIMVTARS
jgi:hypothetical protein